MSRPKPFQHHICHEDAVKLPKGYHSVSLQFLKFMRERDDIQNLNVRWLCSNCYTFEIKALRQNQQMETQWNGPKEEEDERMIIDEHTVDDKGSEENVSSRSDCTTSCSSRESSDSGGDLYTLNYEQEKAWEELNTIFAALDLPPINDQ